MLKYLYLDPRFISIKNDVTSIDEIYRHIFGNRKEETWRAAARSTFEFHRLIEPLPEVVNHLFHLHNLRKSVWAIIDDVC